MELSEKDIEFLKSKGFKQQDKSGFFHIIEDNKEWVLIPYPNHYKIEFYEYGLSDGDGGFYDDYSKEYSEENQSLESFINFWL